MASKSDALMAPILEGALILAAGVIGLAAGGPLLFSSLGPTVFEQVEFPERKSANVYNILVGHGLALGAGFVSLYVTGASAAPEVVASGHVTWPRVWASVLAVALTALATLVLKATQPAALSTTLLVSTGAFDTAWKAMMIVLGVVAVTAIGQPARYLRLHQKEKYKQSEAHPPEREAA